MASVAGIHRWDIPAQQSLLAPLGTDPSPLIGPPQPGVCGNPEQRPKTMRGDYSYSSPPVEQKGTE